MPRNQNKRLRRFLWASLTGLILLCMLASYALEHLGVAPRALAPYIERRVEGHNPRIEEFGSWLASTLMTQDRGEIHTPLFPGLKIGAQKNTAEPDVSIAASRQILVASPAEARLAIANAAPGDVINFLPGIYRFDGGGYISANRAGTSAQVITVKAEQPGTVLLQFNMGEGFLVSAPYWTFENLTIKGACKEDEYCEHAFHVVGNAQHFVARNNTINDFNAQFKINGEGGFYPDNGLIEGNTLSNSSARKSDRPVTMIDLVAASHWHIRRNLIEDFIKGGGDRISYGAFVKGAGSDNRFEQNVVLCEHHLQGLSGQRVGLSFGGGGSGKEYCRDRRCITEQDKGVMEANLIASCSDNGIYVNRSATSRIVHNTLIDTSGISVRFPESSADIEGNLVDGQIHERDGGIVRARDNVETSMTRLYLGMHPVRKLFVDAAEMDLAWQGSAPRRNASIAGLLDLCGVTRPQQAAYGAFEDFTACYRQTMASSAVK